MPNSGWKGRRIADQAVDPTALPIRSAPSMTDLLQNGQFQEKLTTTFFIFCT